MKKDEGIKRETRQILQALLFSKDRDAGLLAYEILSRKTRLDKIGERIKEQSDATRIFWGNVVNGDLKNAIATANEENEEQLNRIQVYQMLQALLACEDKATRGIAVDVLSGEITIKQALALNPGAFNHAVLMGNYKAALDVASRAQRDALNNVTKRDFNFTLVSPQNLQRLHYLMHRFDITLDRCVNDMVKAYYETVRADEHAEFLQNEKPQNYFI